MPIEWIPVLAKAAAGAAASTAVKEAYAGAKGKVTGLLSDAFSKGPLAEPLETAYREAFTGFRGTLAAVLPMDDETERGLGTFAGHEDFMARVGELPYKPFEEVDTTRARELFLNLLGPQGMEERDFESAWRAFGQRFQRAAAKDQGLKNLFDLTRAARQEEGETDRLRTLEEIKNLLQRLTESAEAAARTPDPEPAFRKYREALYQRYRYADTRGLFLREKEGVGEAIELREVFVETPLARRAERKERKEPRGEEKAQARPREEEEGLAQEVLKLGEVLGKERVFVVLGAPGSGKSTLLRCLCLTLCRPEGVEPLLAHNLPPEVIPLLLPLKEYATALRDDADCKLDRFFAEQFEGDLPGLAGLLNSGRVLVLLDGLDEVFDEYQRRWVSDEVWRLVTRYPEARFVLTSRPHGYEAAPMPGPVPRWQLQPFGDEEIGRFLRGWFEALARTGGEAGAEESPQKRSEALTAEILARPNLKEMAQNPLLCTLIVLVHRSRSGRLPERRVRFYEAAVHTFVEVWERSKYSFKQLDLPEPEILLRALAEVAWRALHQLASREIPGPELRAWLLDYLGREPAWKGERGERAVRDLLSLVRDRIGLLVDLGGDRYQFVHLSLHEWLVSYFLRDRLNDAERSEVVRYYLHAPEWEEVLRLLVAGALQAQADALLQDIHSRPTSDLEGLLRRDLRFLHRCLADQAPVGPTIRQALDVASVEAMSDSALVDLQGFLGDLASTGAAVHEAVLSCLGDEDWVVRRAAVEYFNRAGGDDPVTRGAILARLADTNAWVRSEAVTYYLRVKGYGPEARRGSLTLLAEANGNLRCAAVEYFIRIGGNDPETRRALLSSLADFDARVRSAAVEYFSRVKANDPETRRAVLELLLRDEHWSVRNAAVEYFSRVEGDDPETRRTVLDCMGDDNWLVRNGSVEYLSRIGGDDQETRQAFLDLLGDEDWSVRSASVEYFIRVGGDDSKTRRTFLDCLGAADARVRSGALEYFLRVGVDDPETRRAVLECLGHEDWLVRSGAVECFSRFGLDDTETRLAILKRLGDEDAYVRSKAVEYFSRIGGDDPETRRAILERLRNEAREVHSAAFRFFLRNGFDSAVALELMESFPVISPLTTFEENRLFSEKIGHLAAKDKKIQAALTQQGPNLSFFQMGPALRALAAEQERLRRQANPLRLEIPGCQAPKA